MKLGVCADPKFGPILAEAGFEFLELHVQHNLKTLEDEMAFEAELDRIQASPLPALAANCFMPGQLKITGPDADLDTLRDYVVTTFTRAERAGIRHIVFGSGGARSVPEGFDRDKAWQQLLIFGRMIAPLAKEHGVTVMAEPLNVSRGGSNILTSVSECGRYVTAVAHPNVRLLVDSYHWTLDEDSYEDIVRYGDLLHHVHVATTESRVPPGFEPCPACATFFEALGEAGYDGPVSIEAQWDDIEQQAGAAYKHLRSLIV